MENDSKLSILTYLIILSFFICLEYWVDTKYRYSLMSTSDIVLLFNGDKVYSIKDIQASDFKISNDKIAILVKDTISEIHLKRGHELFVKKANKK